MTDQLRDADRDERRSEQELNFEWRWRQLVDRAGGQSLVARRLNWTTSTVSRDYKGDTLPTDERLNQLCDFLTLPAQERLALQRQLMEARAARRARPKGKAAPPASAAGQHVAPGHRLGLSAARAWPPSPVWAVAAVAVVAVVALAAIVWLRPTGSGPTNSGPQPPAAIQPGPKPVGGPYPGLKLKTISIPVTSLKAPLSETFGRSHGAVTGFVFRNSKNTGLCLGATTTGALAGDNKDPVLAFNCGLAPSQIWVPVQWEIDGSGFTWLVNYQYQSKCLNADNIGGMAKRHRVQLWDCYNSSNEEWDFGDWYKGLKSGAPSYPIFVDQSNLCLDADKYAPVNGDKVQIWDQYPTASQFWS